MLELFDFIWNWIIASIGDSILDETLWTAFISYIARLFFLRSQKYMITKEELKRNKKRIEVLPEDEDQLIQFLMQYFSILEGLLRHLLFDNKIPITGCEGLVDKITKLKDNGIYDGDFSLFLSGKEYEWMVELRNNLDHGSLHIEENEKLYEAFDILTRIFERYLESDKKLFKKAYKKTNPEVENIFNNILIGSQSIKERVLRFQKYVKKNTSRIEVIERIVLDCFDHVEELLKKIAEENNVRFGKYDNMSKKIEKLREANLLSDDFTPFIKKKVELKGDKDERNKTLNTQLWSIKKTIKNRYTYYTEHLIPTFDLLAKILLEHHEYFATKPEETPIIAGRIAHATYQTIQVPKRAKPIDPTEITWKTLWWYFCNCWQKTFVYKGRASRAEFWGFMLFDFLITLVLTSIFYKQIIDINTFGIYEIYCIISMLPRFAVISRRLHDVNQSFKLFWTPWIFLFIGACFLIFAGVVYEANPYNSDEMIFILPIILGSLFAIVSLIYFIRVFILYLRKSDPNENLYGPSTQTDMRTETTGYEQSNSRNNT